MTASHDQFRANFSIAVPVDDMSADQSYRTRERDEQIERVMQGRGARAP